MCMRVRSLISYYFPILDKIKQQYKSIYDT